MLRYWASSGGAVPPCCVTICLVKNPQQAYEQCVVMLLWSCAASGKTQARLIIGTPYSNTESYCRAKDVQVELVMLDPYIRTTLQHDDKVGRCSEREGGEHKARSSLAGLCSVGASRQGEQQPG